MKIPVSLREYQRRPNGTVVLVRKIGRSPFMFMSNELIRNLEVKNQTVTLVGERFRIVLPVVPSSGVYRDSALVMKDSLIARLLAWYYRQLDRNLHNLVVREMRFWPLVHEGDTIPWYTISGLLCRTFPEYY